MTSTIASDLVLKLKEKLTSQQLFGLSSISPVRNWDYTLPTLTEAGRFTDRVGWNEDRHFSEQFYEKYPILKHINLDNIALAGGAITSMLIYQTPTDLDFYVISDSNNASEFDGRARAEKFIHDIYEYMHNNNESLKQLELEKQKVIPSFKVEYSKFFSLDNFKVTRNYNVFSIEIPGYIKFQIVTKPFGSLPSLFAGIDLDCTAIAFYNNKIWFSDLGKFCFENLVFCINPCVHQDLSRVIKYFDRGFDIIAPHLDMTKIPTRNFKYGLTEVIDMPHLHIYVSGVNSNDCKIFTSSIRLANEDNTVSPNKLSFGMYRTMTTHSGEIIHKNILSLVHGNYHAFTYEGSGHLYKNSYSNIPIITERMVINSYANVQNKLFANNQLSLTYFSYFSILTKKQLMDKLFTQYLDENEGKLSYDLVLGQTFTKHMEKTIKVLVEDQINSTKEMINTLTEEKIAKRVKEVEIEREARQPLTEVEWYGTYYKTIS